MASLALVNGGTDLLLDLDEKKGRIFGTISGGHKRYKTGSYADIDSVNLATGLSHTFKGQRSDTTIGAFVETGYGDIDTHSTIGGIARNGDGTAKYVGVGALARYDVTEGSLKGFYARGAIHGGRLFTSFSNKNALNGMNYDLDSNYYAGHIGVGFKKDLPRSVQMDTRAQYMFSRIAGKNVTIQDSTYHFKDTDSHRIHLGARFNYVANPTVHPFLSFAWEHEFDGKAKTTLNGYTLESSNLTGSTGIVKMGLTIKPSKESGFSLDADIAGFFGEQEGFNGKVRIQYLF